jgi:diguanylate cyclase (GGDEF)-like protein
LILKVLADKKILILGFVFFVFVLAASIWSGFQAIQVAKGEMGRVGLNSSLDSLTTILTVIASLAAMSMVFVALASWGLWRRNNELAELSAKLARRADTDSATGLFNHRHFHSHLGKQLERCRRYDEKLSLIMLDLDHFKEINDLYGHQVGDRALLEIVKIIRQVFRGIDYAARYGGDEFAIVLPGTEASEALVAGERLCLEVAKSDLGLTGVDGNPVRLTISGGVADSVSGSADREALIGLADQALLFAKNLGRDRMCRHEEIRRHRIRQAV